MRKVWAIWSRLRSNYWFIPTSIIGLGFGLAYGMLKLDTTVSTDYILHLGWIYTRDAAGARALLSVTAQSTITVAGVVFSITTVALTFASNQFGTRILRNFIRDAGNQIVFGIFLATFLYCLIVMRRVEGGNGANHGFVPSLSVAMGIFLAVGSTFTLVYFIHHVIVSMEAETVVARVAEDLRETVEALFPEKMGKDESQASAENKIGDLPPDCGARPKEICCGREGYIGNIDSDKLLTLTMKHDLIVKILCRPGDFVFEDFRLAKAWPEGSATEEVCDNIRKSFNVSRRRTSEQDFGFGLHQLVLLTTRSLSPAINSVGTAMDSIDRVGAALVLVGNRKMPSGYRYDKNDSLRLVTQPWDLEKLTESLFAPLRTAAASQPVVMHHLLTTLGSSVAHIANAQLKRALVAQMHLLVEASRNFPQAIDRIRVERAYDRAFHNKGAA